MGATPSQISSGALAAQPELVDLDLGRAFAEEEVLRSCVPEHKPPRRAAPCQQPGQGQLGRAVSLGRQPGCCVLHSTCSHGNSNKDWSINSNLLDLISCYCAATLGSFH